MVAVNEGRPAASFILSEANGQRSRANVTIGASQTITAGDLIAKVTTGGAIVKYAPAAADGSQTPTAIALYSITTGVGEVNKSIACIVRDAEVNGKVLNFGTADAGQKTAAIAALATVGIIVR